MKKYLKLLPALSIATAAIIFGGCSKQDFGAQSTLVADTTGTLKSVAQYKIGCGVNGDTLISGGQSSAIIKAQFDNVTPGNWLKQASILGNTGIYNFTNADKFVNYCMANGLGVYGHVLVWHSQQTSKYLVDSLINKPQSYVTTTVPPTNIPVANNDFEIAGSPLANWAVYNTQNATITQGNAAESYHGNGCMKVVNTVANGQGNSWKVQVANDDITVVNGTNYTIKLWAKAAAVGANGFRFEIGGGSGTQYLSHLIIGTSYAQYSWTFTATGTTHKLILDLGADANTYWIDSVSVTKTGSGSTVTTAVPPTAAEIKYRVDTSMRNYITTVVSRYRTTIKAWDVVNEPIKDDGTARTNDYDYAAGLFYRAKYLGLDSMCYKAFTYARAANPDAKLFLNEYGIESNTTKLDSLIALITRLKAMGTPIDGIGLQMHMLYSQPTTGIDNALLKLAHLGLLVRISEADVALNPVNTVTPSTNVTFIPTPILYTQQAAKYRYMVESFYTNVPAAQRFGITVWDLSDNASWLNDPLKPDYPTLYDRNLKPKLAYTEFLKALQFKK